MIAFHKGKCERWELPEWKKHTFTSQTEWGMFWKIESEPGNCRPKTSETSKLKIHVFCSWCLQSSCLRINLEVTQVTQHLFQIIHVDVRTSYALKPIEGFSDTSVLNHFFRELTHLTGYNFIFTSTVYVGTILCFPVYFVKDGAFFFGRGNKCG